MHSLPLFVDFVYVIPLEWCSLREKGRVRIEFSGWRWRRSTKHLEGKLFQPPSTLSKRDPCDLGCSIRACILQLCIFICWVALTAIRIDEMKTFQSLVTFSHMHGLFFVVNDGCCMLLLLHYVPFAQMNASLLCRQKIQV